MTDEQKIAPVQGYTPGIPWSLHLEAYDAYSKKWGPQPALIDLEGRGCRGGFSVRELDDFIPGWRDRVSEVARLSALLAAKPQGTTAVFLTADEIAFVMNELRPDHDGSDFEAECPSCTAFKKLAAAAPTQQEKT